MVFQSYALYPNMTVAQNIAFGLEMRSVPKPERDRAVKEVAETLQISQLLSRKPSQLSGGQRQRVAMGRALVRNPQVFLFDEPLSNLDAKLRVDMRTEIKQLHLNLGTTIVYVTHDQVEAMTLATVIAVLRDGSDPAVRHAGGDLQQARQHLRRRFHGLALDEPRAGRGGARQRRDGRVARTRRAASRCSCRWRMPAPALAAQGRQEGDPRHPPGGGDRRRRRGPACAQRRAGRLHGRGGRAGRLRHLCRRASRRRAISSRACAPTPRSRRRARRCSPSTWTGRASSTRKRNSGSTDERDAARTDGNAAVGLLLRPRRRAAGSR